MSGAGACTLDPAPLPVGRARAGLRLAATLGLTAGSAARLFLGGRPEKAVSAWSRGLLRTLAVDVVVEGSPDAAAPLWVANHLSWLDPIVLMSLRPMGTLAKAEVASYPLIGPLAARAGLRFVERGEPDSRAAALAALSRDLSAGRPMLLFPEGTTTRGQGAPMYPGGLLAAYELGVPVQPLHLSSSDRHYPWVDDDELVSHLKGLAAARRTTVRVAPGPLLHPGTYTCAGAWLSAARQALRLPCLPE